MTDTDDVIRHPDRHDSRSTVERLGLIERDLQSHARSLSALIDGGKAFSTEQLGQLRTIIREELADAGLRIDGPEHVDASREDFRFLRRLRTNYDGAAKKVGNTVLGAIVALGIAIIGAGFWAWLSSHLGKS